MLADSFYAEENEQYMFAALTHGSDAVKNWPGGQPMLGYRVQRRTPVTYRQVAEAVGQPTLPVYSEEKNARMDFYLKATGGKRRILFGSPEVGFVDRQGNAIHDITESDIILPARNNG